MAKRIRVKDLPVIKSKVVRVETDGASERVHFADALEPQWDEYKFRQTKLFKPGQVDRGDVICFQGRRWWKES